MANPVSKRGLYRQVEPDPSVVDLSDLIFKLGHGNFTMISDKAKELGYSLAASTVAKTAYLETIKPRNETRDAILAALNVTTQLILPDGTIYKQRDRDDAIKEWHRRQKNG